MSDTEQAHLFGEPSDKPQQPHNKTHTKNKDKSSTKGQGGQSAPYTIADFVREFSKLAPHKHRYDVFRDFVTISAIAIYNAVAKDENYEAEYMKIIGGYKKEEVGQFAHFFAQVTMMLDPAPYDVLGEVYTALGLANAKTSQYFTPWPIAEFMTQIVHGEALADDKKPFVTVSEPSCGSGVMVLAFAKGLIAQGHNPAQRMWAECIDIDRLAALMCYVQLSLWNIPAVVIVGNGLTGEVREAFHTPAHYLGEWDEKFRMARMIDAMRDILGRAQAVTSKAVDDTTAEADAEKVTDDAPSASSEPPKPMSQNPMQFDFEF